MPLMSHPFDAFDPYKAHILPLPNQPFKVVPEDNIHLLAVPADLVADLKAFIQAKRKRDAAVEKFNALAKQRAEIDKQMHELADVVDNDPYFNGPHDLFERIVAAVDKTMP